MNEESGDRAPPGRRPDAPRLTDDEKKKNHIKSEKKRREAIRDGFDRLAEAVGLPGQGRSEAVVLQGATTFLKAELAKRFILFREAQRRGIDTKQWEYDKRTMQLAEKYAYEYGHMLNEKGERRSDERR